jgi:hypothetical protein
VYPLGPTSPPYSDLHGRRCRRRRSDPRRPLDDRGSQDVLYAR